MHILCRAGRHRARPSSLCNQGLYFSTCSRCDQDMVRSGTRWKRIQPGFRVVWKRPMQRSVANLPALYVAPVPVPLVRDERVARTAKPRRRMTATGIALSALHLLIGYCFDSLRRWQEIEASRRPSRRPALRLTGPS